jgi:hypothetical protein
MAPAIPEMPNVLPIGPSTAPIAPDTSLEQLTRHVTRLNLVVFGLPENEIYGLLHWRKAVDDYMKRMQRNEWILLGLGLGLAVNGALSALSIVLQVAGGRLPIP